MNKNDIELPPLPEGIAIGYGWYGDNHMEAYAIAAIEADRIKRDDYINDDRDQLRAEIVALKGTIADLEADRKRRTSPNEPFAIVIDRMYDGEGPSLAYWNGENYQFSDGDCFNREGDTLDGYTAEFLTDYQLEQRLFSDRQRRGEPVAYGIKAANTGKIVTVLYGRDVDQVGEYRADLVVPLFTAPQPAEPVTCFKCGHPTHRWECVNVAPQPAETGREVEK